MIRRSFITLAAVAALAACGMPHQKAAETPAAAAPAPATVILVHGAFVDGSGWAPTKAELERLGDKVVVVEMPGRPTNPKPAAEVSLDAYRDAVLAAVNAETAPVVLVGHSAGGISISNVAEAVPEKIKTLVYVAAYLPQSGQSLQTLSSTDAESALGKALKIDAAGGVGEVDMAQRAAIFCNDCAPEVAAAIPAQMVPEPLALLGSPVTLTPEKFGAVDKIYVRTAQDRAVGPALQDRMVAATPVREVIRLDAGHLPMLSKPVELAAAIDAAARR
ncbi:MAG: alpha/beta fold hydrolase [Hyphomonadaceae bacterium]|nr:alpha/beta fold hydrolase [Hyphomonadaceae bacterium]